MSHGLGVKYVTGRKQMKTNKQTNRQTDKQTNTNKHKRTNKQTSKQTQTNKQTEKQANKHKQTNKQKNKQMNNQHKHKHIQANKPPTTNPLANCENLSMFKYYFLHRLQVLDEDRLGRNDFIGETTVPLKHVLIRNNFNMQRILEPKSEV